MVEKHVERTYSGASDEQERTSSGPMTLVSVSADHSGSDRGSGPSVLEALDQRAALASRPPVHVQPWQAAAQAKGRPGYFRAKRCLDVALAALALLLCFPLMVLVALLVWLTSPGPAFFRQERVGYGGRRFMMYKFRSMYVDSDDRLHRAAYEQFLRGERSIGKVDGELLAKIQQEEGSNGYAPMPRRRRFFKTHDPRITPLGHLLRISSIDELPQFLNVLRGDMSIVGPRPPIPYEVGLYQPWHLGRLDTLPGITGLWQVHGRSRVTFDQMVQMDLEYIQKQSFWYDIKLLVLTIPAVLSRKGAY